MPTETSIETLGPFPFTGPIKGATENRAAHGCACFTDRRSDGSTRERNVNGSHVETGPWVGATRKKGQTQLRLRDGTEIANATMHKGHSDLRVVVAYGEALWIVWEACGHFGVVAGIVAAVGEHDAYEALIDELPTVPEEDLHAAYGFDTSEDFAAFLDGVWPEEMPEGGPDLVEGYAYQSNFTGTGIVWTQDLGWPQPLTKSVLDASGIELAIGHLDH